MSAITPNPQQFQQLAMAPDDGPVTMLNLLKFKQRAGDGNGSGADAYARYSEAAVQMVEGRGGRIVWQGRAEQTLIGDEAEDWDAVALVEYPSRKAFLEMAMSKQMGEIHHNREAGLERTVLIACRELSGGEP
ncbi:MAG: DUF1330 domain-containing protein [Chloroflexota bacterium]|nr:DUF1330 domain-containing protein [Chloroflexota bacterium]